MKNMIIMDKENRKVLCSLLETLQLTDNMEMALIYVMINDDYDKNKDVISQLQITDGEQYCSLLRNILTYDVDHYKVELLLERMCEYDIGAFRVLYMLYNEDDSIHIKNNRILKEVAKIAYAQRNYNLFEKLLKRVVLDINAVEMLLKLDVLSSQFRSDLYIEALRNDHIEHMYPYAKWYCHLEEEIEVNINYIIFCLRETYDINDISDVIDLVYLYRKTHNYIEIKELYKKALCKGNKDIINYISEKLK